MKEFRVVNQMRMRSGHRTYYLQYKHKVLFSIERWKKYKIDTLLITFPSTEDALDYVNKKFGEVKIHIKYRTIMNI